MARRAFLKGIAVVGAPAKPGAAHPILKRAESHRGRCGGCLGRHWHRAIARQISVVTNKNAHDEHGLHQVGIGAHDHSGARLGDAWAPTGASTAEAHEPVLVLRCPRIADHVAAPARVVGLAPITVLAYRAQERGVANEHGCLWPKRHRSTHLVFVDAVFTPASHQIQSERSPPIAVCRRCRRLAAQDATIHIDISDFIP
jgi:hypothetical protein